MNDAATDAAPPRTTDGAKAAPAGRRRHAGLAVLGLLCAAASLAALAALKGRG